MFFQEDYNAQEEAHESPQASGPRLFFRIIGQEAAALLKLNLIFLLACLPVVTIPPALLALCQSVRRMLADQTVRSWRDFWGSFRRSWRQGYAVFALTAASLAAAGCGAQFYLRFAADSPVFYLPFMFCAAVFLTAVLASSYLYGLLACGRRLTRETAALALRLGLGRPLRAALAAVIWYGSLTVMLLWFPLSGIYLLLMGFSIPCLLALFFVRTVLERFGGEQEY